MMNIGSFRDLRRLIRVSPKSRHLFKLYKNTIRNQVAKNLFGESYQAITTVLTYRNSSCLLVRNGPDYATSEALVSKGFIFNTTNTNRADALLCAFETSLERYRSLDFEIFKDPNIPEINNEIPFPSFSQANPFSKDLFFRTLRRFQQHMFENINTYIETLPSKKDELDMYWISRIISFAYEPRDFGVFTTSWGCALDSENFEELQGRPLLSAKFENEFLDVVDESGEDADDQVNAFYNDYDLGGGKGHMAMMIAKYKMNRVYG
jgi:hypothetical protein